MTKRSILLPRHLSTIIGELVEVADFDQWCVLKMSHEPISRSHRPTPEAKIEVRGYKLAIRFHPDIKLGVKRGHQFATALAEYVSLEKNEFQSHKWTFREPLAGEPASEFVIIVTPNSLVMEVVCPSQKQEWVENRFDAVLAQFGEHFEPQMLLNTQATVRGLLPVDGDARTCLGGRVMKIHPDVLFPFKRPVHVLGLRFFFPPYKQKGKGDEATEWAVDVKIESSMEDPSKLVLEAKADWFDGEPWEDGIVDKLVRRMDTVRVFLDQNVVDFLNTTTSEDDSSEDDEEEGQI